MKDCEIKFFRDIYKNIKGNSECERNLIPQETEKWLRSTMTNKRFNFLSILSIHKDITDKIDSVDVGYEFVSLYVSLYDSRYLLWSLYFQNRVAGPEM